MLTFLIYADKLLHFKFAIFRYIRLHSIIAHDVNPYGTKVECEKYVGSMFEIYIETIKLFSL